MTSPRPIEIWTSLTVPDSPTLQEKAAPPSLGFTGVFGISHVDPTELTKNLRDFLSHFQSLALDPEVQGGPDFAVQEIELSLGINGKGGIALVGKIEVGVAAGIKVKLVRRGKSS